MTEDEMTEDEKQYIEILYRDLDNARFRLLSARNEREDTNNKIKRIMNNINGIKIMINRIEG